MGESRVVRNVEKSWRASLPQSNCKTSESTQDAFNRIILADILKKDGSHSNLCTRNRGVGWPFVNLFPLVLDNRRICQKARTPARAMLTTLARRMLPASQEFLGIIPTAMNISNKLFIFFGSQVLHVLRDAINDLHEFFGECYVHDLMY